LDRRLGGHQSRSGRGGEESYKKKKKKVCCERLINDKYFIGYSIHSHAEDTKKKHGSSFTSRK
jgi:hypothetical protein